MNTKILIGILVVAVLGIGVWYVAGSKDMADNGTGIVSEKETSGDTELLPSGSGSLKDLFVYGKNMQCTFTSNHEGERSEGIFYLSEDLYRVDSVVTNEGQSFNSSMIYTPEKMYVWSKTAAGDFAMVFSIPDEERADFTEFEDESGTSRGPVSMNGEIDYDCKPWSVNPTMFVPPGDVEFVDTEAVMNSMTEVLPEGFEGFDRMPISQ